MYELKCSSCGHVVTSSFVRIGAVVVCSACGVRYRVAEAHVTHSLASMPPAASDPSNPLVLDETGIDPSDSSLGLRVDDSGVMIGLSGLSETMRQGRDDAVPHAMSQPPAGRLRHQPAGHRQPIALSDNRKVRLGVALLGLLGVLCISIYMLMALANPAAPKDDPPPPVGPLPDLPLVDAVRLIPTSWEIHNRPVRAPGPAENPAAWLAETGPVLPGGVFEARVATNRIDMVVDAEVTLSMVDAQNMELARTRVPTSLFNDQPRRPRMIRVPLPEQTPPGMRMVSSVKILQTLRGGVFLEPPSVWPIETDERNSHVRVRIQNSSHRAMSRIIVLIVALDERGAPLGQWQVQWNEPLEAGQEIDLQVRLDDPVFTIPTTWRAEAAGG